MIQVNFVRAVCCIAFNFVLKGNFEDFNFTFSLKMNSVGVIEAEMVQSYGKERPVKHQYVHVAAFTEIAQGMAYKMSFAKCYSLCSFLAWFLFSSLH